MCKNKYCLSERIADVSGKTSDLFFIRIAYKEHIGYVLGDIGIGDGDYMEFSYCLDCGQIQSKFPIPITKLEKNESEDE